MKSVNLFFCFFILTSCCFKSTKVLVSNRENVPQDKILSYEGDNVFFAELRGELSKKGIKALKYNKIDTIVSKNNDNMQIIEQGVNVKNSRYLLSMYTDIQAGKICLVNSDSNVHKVLIEITDLKNNEVIFSVRITGMNEPCGYCRTTFFQTAADEIYKYFQGK